MAIVFIGPICAGKSTIAQLAAERLGVPRHELDHMRWAYYAERGYDDQLAAQVVQREGIVGLTRYWKPFEAHAVARLLADAPDAVIDFGAGHSVYDDPALFAAVQQALAGSVVVLLLPSPDHTASVRILNERLSGLLEREMGYVDPAILALNESFVAHPSNLALATHVVYTRDSTPEQVCDEVVRRLTEPH